MDFNSLNVGKTTTKKVVVKPRQLNTSVVINNALSFDNLVGKKSKIIPEVEPGIKVPITQYRQIGQFCEECLDIVMHVRDPKNKTIMCMNCKTSYKYE